MSSLVQTALLPITERGPVGSREAHFSRPNLRVPGPRSAGKIAENVQFNTHAGDPMTSGLEKL